MRGKHLCEVQFKNETCIISLIQLIIDKSSILDANLNLLGFMMDYNLITTYALCNIGH